MIIQFLGLFDIVAATLILFGKMIPETIMLFVAGYISLKGIIFLLIGDVASTIDILVGLYCILMIFGFYFLIVNIVCAFFLYQKGFVSII